MHLSVNYNFDDMLESGIDRMGNGGGFRVVVFTGSGYIRNNGDRGYENWHCSGICSQNGNVINFQSQKIQKSN